MGAPASQYDNISGTNSQQTYSDARVLRRIVVNTGVAAATVTVVDGSDNAIAVIAADNPDIGRRYDIQVNGLKVTPSDSSLDVTVCFD